MKIRLRLTLAITALVATVLLLVMTLSATLVSRAVHASVDRALLMSAAQLTSMAEMEEGHLHLERWEDGHLETPLGEEKMIRLLDPQGVVIDGRGVTTVPVDTAVFGTEPVLVTVLMSDNPVLPAGSRLRVATVPVVLNHSVVAYLQVGESLQAVESTLSLLGRSYAWLLPLALVLSAIGSYILAGRALEPIERIRRRAAETNVDQLQDGLGKDFPDDEVGRLARTFDEMLRRLGSSFLRQKRFTADAIHELRTPVAIIRGVAEVALAKSRSEAEYRANLETILSETESTTRLIEGLLFLARSDSDHMNLRLEIVSLPNLLEALGDYLPDFQANITIDVPPGLTVTVDKDRLLQVVFNLLENVKVHAPGCDINITARASQGRVKIAFRDYGPGVAPEHLALLTERFYRVDSSRSRVDHSTGLGLAISLEIIQAHGGTLALESVPGHGLTVTLDLPEGKP